MRNAGGSPISGPGSLKLKNPAALISEFYEHSGLEASSIIKSRKTCLKTILSVHVRISSNKKVDLVIKEAVLGSPFLNKDFPG